MKITLEKAGYENYSRKSSNSIPKLHKSSQLLVRTVHQPSLLSPEGSYFVVTILISFSHCFLIFSLPKSFFRYLLRFKDIKQHSGLNSQIVLSVSYCRLTQMNT